MSKVFMFKNIQLVVVLDDELPSSIDNSSCADCYARYMNGAVCTALNRIHGVECLEGKHRYMLPIDAIASKLQQ